MNQSIQYNNTTIAFSETGTGPTLVLLHGFLETKAIWQDFCQRLEKQLHLITIDLPGHGESGNLNETHSMDLMAQCVQAVLEHLKVSECVMAGHSMGGYVSLAYARLYPHMLKGLILFHSHASADTEEAKLQRLRTINIVKVNRQNFIQQFIPALFAPAQVKKNHELIQLLKATAAHMEPSSIVAALNGMRERNSGLDYLVNAKIPIGFIIGKEDPRIPLQKIVAQTLLPAHAEILILDQVGHMGYAEAPEKTNPFVRDFVLRAFN